MGIPQGTSLKMATEPSGNVRFVAVMCPEKELKIASYLYYTADTNTSKYDRMLKVLVKADNPSIDRNSFKVEDAGLVTYCVEIVDGLRMLHIVVTALDYPERLANQLAEKLRTAFSQKFKAQYGTAGEDQLSKSAKKCFEPICSQFDDPTAADKVAAVQKQAEAVSAVMADNVKVMLDNQGKLEEVEDKSHALKENAKAFKKSSTELKNQQWWRNIKFTIALAALVIVLIIAIVVPIVLKLKGSSDDEEMELLQLPASNIKSAPTALHRTSHSMKQEYALTHDSLAEVLISDIFGRHQ